MATTPSWISCCCPSKKVATIDTTSVATTFTGKCRDRDSRTLLCLSATYCWVAVWIGIVILFSHAGVTETVIQAAAPLCSWLHGLVENVTSVVGLNSSASGKVQTSAISRETAIEELGRIYAALLLGSSCLSAMCCSCFQLHLKQFLALRSNTCLKHKEGSHYLLDYDGSSELDEPRSRRDGALLVVTSILTAIVIVGNGMFSGHVISVMSHYYTVNPAHLFSFVLFSAFIFYFCCCGLAVFPALWHIMGGVEFVVRDWFVPEDDSSLNPQASVPKMCEICDECILPGEVQLLLPSVGNPNRGESSNGSETSPTVFECQYLDNRGSCGDDSSISHYSHLLCFTKWGGVKCPACPSNLAYNSFDIIDNIFAWVYIFSIVALARVVDKFWLQRAVAGMSNFCGRLASNFEGVQDKLSGQQKSTDIACARDIA
eukprot:GHVQ01015068.1.p1 GENE.GHVQ01015068.1~~GHVQ01015068.1.p1  ORF type:complete len:430 (+),score=32.66 GHVQ01015068.1:351-1640(+)